MVEWTEVDVEARLRVLGDLHLLPSCYLMRLLLVVGSELLVWVGCV